MNFEAGTQYGDWKGTAAVDEHGGVAQSLSEVFEATGNVDTDEEVLIGFSFYAEGGHLSLEGFYHRKSRNPDIGGWVPTLNKDFLLSKDSLQVKSVRAEVAQEVFFHCFKRFNVVLIRSGLDIIGRDYEVTEET